MWIEAWDSTYNLPYYLNFATGESQWQWPSEYDEDGRPVHIVQHGSEDYNWCGLPLPDRTGPTPFPESRSETHP